MKIVLAYVHPNLNHSVYQPMARRFVESYMHNPPGTTDHELHVIVNGPAFGPLQSKKLFNPLPVTLHQHNNMGKDIGAFIMASQTIPCDLLVCLGAHVFFVTPCWLDLIVKSFLDYGPGLYGHWCFMEPKPHVRTTAFWLPPDLLRSYPFAIGDPQRYAFEHGSDSITLWTRRVGFPVYQVTNKGVFDFDNWHPCEPDEYFMGDQHTDRARIAFA